MRRKRQDYINSAMNAAGKKPVPPPQYNKKRHEEAAEAFSKTQKKNEFFESSGGSMFKAAGGERQERKSNGNFGGSRVHTAAATQGGFGADKFINDILSDPDKLLIAMTLIILLREGGDLQLILALGYVLLY